MKKVILIITAFALVLGITQCKKQENPEAIGKKQHIVLNASWGNGSPKIDQNGVGLKWTVGDIIKVAQGTTELGSLECTDVDGTFEGEITVTEGNITFSFGSENFRENFMNQTGVLNDAILLSGEAAYNTQGNYSVEMTMPHAVLKLDLSEIGTTEGTTATIYANGIPVASVANVTTTSSAVYMAVPANGESKTYGFDIVTKGDMNWTLNANTFYTSKDGDAGAAIKIVPAEFSVANGKKIRFSKGNMFYDGSAFKFEDNQWSFKNTWDPSHVSHFCWSAYEDEAVMEEYDGWEIATEYDVLFTNDPDFADMPNSDFTVNGETGKWRTLSETEWSYLLGFDMDEGGQNDDCGRTNATKLCARSEVTFNASGTIKVKGLIIMDDYWSGTLSATTDYNTWQTLESAGAVFLPATGSRVRSGVINVGSEGGYWSSALDGSYEYCFYPYYMAFSSNILLISNYASRAMGVSVRLVSSAS